MGGSTSNGYFGAWMAFASTMWIARITLDLDEPADAMRRASSLAGGAPIEILVLLFASLVVLLAATLRCYRRHCGTYNTLAGICAAVSLVLNFAIILGKSIRPNSKKVDSCLAIVAAFLMIWWAAGTLCMTFVGPFKVLGNGYFGAWVALLAAVSLAVNVGVLGRFRLRGVDLTILATASLVLLLQSLFDGVWERS